MRIVVLTGMSGSGKTNALRALEDVGYYAIDNLPIPLIERLVDLFSATKGEFEKLALVVDARTVSGSAEVEESSLGGAVGELRLASQTIERTRTAGHDVDVLFLDAEDDVLVRRFSETRRRHPLGADGSVRGGIAAERPVLEPLRRAATMVLDTSQMSVHELRSQVQLAFLQRGSQVGPQLRATVMSFGFKHGVPTEADLVFDVRFLPNPYFVEGLRPKTGEHEEVARYVLACEETKGFLSRLESLLAFLVPQYENEGKAYLTVAFGCTGGRHRSVALAAYIAEWLKGLGLSPKVIHRDMGR